MDDVFKETAQEIIEVLNFYADKDNYYDSVEFGQGLISEIKYDRGVKAKEMLQTIMARALD